MPVIGSIYFFLTDYMFGLLDGLSWLVSDWRDWTNLSDFAQIGWRHFFRAHCAFFDFDSSFLTFFPCFFVLFKSCCSHTQVFRRTLLYEFHFFYSHTEWNLLFLKKSILWHEASWENFEASIKLETEITKDDWCLNYLCYNHFLHKRYSAHGKWTVNSRNKIGVQSRS